MHIACVFALRAQLCGNVLNVSSLWLAMSGRPLMPHSSDDGLPGMVLPITDLLHDPMYISACHTEVLGNSAGGSSESLEGEEMVEDDIPEMVTDSEEDL
ncbi:hypothetical protein QCA50_016673 [Cerrena zonata]|uniref:Uncharacterized protein n=1 Tax=Cerrena zonata TaxID=2478898 RepID=A0AAW0FME0_9APHY